MAALAMMITNAGLDAIVAAESGGTDEIRITAIGLTATPFLAAPTLDALPGEFKRVDAVSGQAITANVIHVTAYDPSADVYDVTGIGIYTDAGVLLAVYSAEENAVLSKAQLATGLIMFDIAFANNMAALIEFGDALFLNPPASEDVKGVAEIATNAEADNGLDDTRIMSPKKTKRVLDALATTLNAAFVAVQGTVNAAITALQARTISGGGLVTGGGNLTADRVLTVTAANTVTMKAGIVSDQAITPAVLSSLPRSLAQNGSCELPGTGGLIIKQGRFTAAANGSTSVVFALAFPNECFAVITDGGLSSASIQDNYVNVLVGTITASGFSAYNNQSSYQANYIAIGH
ncbi:gp53-like domain-containing protein [Blastomonas sp.]|uniref:gp53-like domain-containing protein n=1 Tax=Blastomonas sp. TaxID=1909299 RepID=UPI00406A1AAE